MYVLLAWVLFARDFSLSLTINTKYRILNTITSSKFFWHAFNAWPMNHWHSRRFWFILIILLLKLRLFMIQIDCIESYNIHILIIYGKFLSKRSAQEFIYSFMNFHAFIYLLLFSVCPSFLWSLKIQKRHELHSSIILFQQQWQQQLLSLPLIQTVIMGVLMLVQKLSPKQNNNII